VWVMAGAGFLLGGCATSGVSFDMKSYSVATGTPRETVATLKNNGKAVSGASLSFQITKEPKYFGLFGAPPDYSGKAKVGTTNADGHATMQVTCTYDESHAVGAVTVTSKNPAGIDTAELTCDPVIKEEPRSSSGPG
ncbi:MAG TPA: hypothetical protein VL588_10055, partial [Bdellovibrionota bacterium]|nr:hypothetical protein [Bdellovibrionota bacterium]